MYAKEELREELAHIMMETEVLLTAIFRLKNQESWWCGSV
jgi:hypothetical protein